MGLLIRTGLRVLKPTRPSVRPIIVHTLQIQRSLVHKGNPVRIFPKTNGLTGLLSSGINLCPRCGKELQFLE